MDEQTTDYARAAESPHLARTSDVWFVAVRGSGAPGSREFYRKMRLIEDIARELDGTGQTPPVEIDYWYPDGLQHVEIADFYTVNSIADLQYRIMARVDQPITQGDVDAARTAARSLSDQSEDRMEPFFQAATQVVQVLHRGSFAEEWRTLDALGAFARAGSLTRAGAHREIHLDAFSADTPQAALRTILRDPVH